MPPPPSRRRSQLGRFADLGHGAPLPAAFDVSADPNDTSPEAVAGRSVVRSPARLFPLRSWCHTARARACVADEDALLLTVPN